MITEQDLRPIFSENLQKALVARGWTQGELARRLFGKSKPTTADRVKISRWIKRINLPDATELRNLADVLATSIDMLLTEK